MAGTYYSAVAGDPLDNAPGSYVVDHYRGDATIQGPDGIFRSMALLGDKAYCDVCKSEGIVVAGAHLQHSQRMNFVAHGTQQAVGDDVVICKCAEHPRIVATYGVNWRIEDGGYSEHIASTAGPSNVLAPQIAYDECVILCSHATGEPVRNVKYRFIEGSNVIAEGVTDERGRTMRVSRTLAYTLKIQVQGI
jgi:hypothetical protein